MEETVGENMTQNLTASTLTFSSWIRELENQNILLHSHTNKYVQSYCYVLVFSGAYLLNEFYKRSLRIFNVDITCQIIEWALLSIFVTLIN